MKIYLAGPMRGYPQYNFPAFNAAAKQLRDEGYEVWSPAEADINADGFDPEKDEAKPMAHYMKRDLPAVCDADALAMLPGWEKSTGAKLEVHVARALGKPILDAATLQPIAEEIRVTDPVTGGQKGCKLARFSLIPSEALWALAEVYGRGSKKYSPHNWRKGYAWSLSMDALERHYNAWKQGGTVDEDGNPHIIQVAWHCFTLFVFQLLGLGTDDRAK